MSVRLSLRRSLLRVCCPATRLNVRLRRPSLTPIQKPATSLLYYTRTRKERQDASRLSRSSMGICVDFCQSLCYNPVRSWESINGISEPRRLRSSDLPGYGAMAGRVWPETALPPMLGKEMRRDRFCGFLRSGWRSGRLPYGLYHSLCRSRSCGGASSLGCRFLFCGPAFCEPSMRCLRTCPARSTPWV